MPDIDPAAVEREKQSLKGALTYRSVRHDIGFLLADEHRLIFAEARRAGHGWYGVASEFVTDCYYERGTLEPLVKA